MASVHVEASPVSSHEAHLGVCESKEWRQPGEQISASDAFASQRLASTSSVLSLSVIHFYCGDFIVR